VGVGLATRVEYAIDSQGWGWSDSHRRVGLAARVNVRLTARWEYDLHLGASMIDSHKWCD